MKIFKKKCPNAILKRTKAVAVFKNQKKKNSTLKGATVKGRRRRLKTQKRHRTHCVKNCFKKWMCLKKIYCSLKQRVLHVNLWIALYVSGDESWWVAYVVDIFMPNFNFFFDILCDVYDIKCDVFYRVRVLWRRSCVVFIWIYFILFIWLPKRRNDDGKAETVVLPTIIVINYTI